MVAVRSGGVGAGPACGVGAVGIFSTHTDGEVAETGDGIMRKVLATLAMGTALAFAAPNSAEAQGPVVTGGVVNVTLVDVVNVGDVGVNVLNNVGIGVAANVAAQICGLQVALPIGVIASSVARQGQYTVCTITDQETGEQQFVQISRWRQ
jgi:hypothetical protein